MKQKLPPTLLSTAQVAEGLGVSVSSVKRWVESGILPATKTAGGHRKLLVADVIEFAKRNNMPLNSTLVRGGTRVRELPDPSSLWRELHHALLKGDASATRAIVHGTYQNGMPLESLADDVVGPAMARIGKEWETGSFDVMHEHRASQLCAGVLIELRQELETRARRKRPLAVGAAPAGDQSVLGTLLAQMVLIDNGWDAVNLGPNTPLKSLGLAIRELRPQLVWLSISYCEDAQVFGREVASLYRIAQGTGAALVIGGRALAEPLRSALRYTAFGDGLVHLAAFAQTLYSQARRPRRGRPSQS